MPQIDVGIVPVDMDSALVAGNTLVNKTNAAPVGTFDKVQIWAKTDLGGCLVGLFEAQGSDNYNCHDHETIGTVTAGSVQTFTGMSLVSKLGSYIGTYFATGTLEHDTTGHSGILWVAGDQLTDHGIDGYSKDYVSGFSLYGSFSPRPTDVAATNGDHTDKVVVTWTKAVGATGYQVYRDSVGLGWLGDVATYDDEDADAGDITAGSAVASDGAHTEHVLLGVTGEAANNGTTHTYVVRAKAATWEGDDSLVGDTGYRSIGALTYQWLRSEADLDESFATIVAGTIEAYEDTGAPV